jgi:integrase
MYEAQAWRLVRRLARRAGLKAAGQLSPHSLRHTFATSLDDAGVPLQDIQDAMGHADPRTTRRYMATHQHLDRHATYAFAAWLRRAPGGDSQRLMGPYAAMLSTAFAPAHGTFAAPRG